LRHVEVDGDVKVDKDSEGEPLKLLHQDCEV
jgi:hypothetical protein